MGTIAPDRAFESSGTGEVHGFLEFGECAFVHLEINKVDGVEVHRGPFRFVHHGSIIHGSRWLSTLVVLKQQVRSVRTQSYRWSIRRIHHDRTSSQSRGL